MSDPSSSAGHALRAALSAPAVVTMIVAQVTRVLDAAPLVSLVLSETVFVATAAIVARRVPTMGWGFVPAMWIGVALGALADALWLGGRLAELPALLFAAPALAAGFALARSWPRRGTELDQ